MRRCAYVKPDWNALTSGAGSVALVDRMIKAGLIDEVCQQPLLVAAGVAFAGLRFPCEVIVVAVRWYLLNLPYRDVEELVVQRGVEVDHVSGFRTYELDHLSDQAGPRHRGEKAALPQPRYQLPVLRLRANRARRNLNESTTWLPVA
jgi:hypothetical protein